MYEQRSANPTRDPADTLAGFGARFAGSLVDTVVLYLLAIPLAGVGFVLGAAFRLALGVAYFVWFEGGPSGQTLGKRLAGIRVADATTGGPIGRGRALIRHIGRWVSLIAFGMGYLWMLWDPERQTWHDKMAGSIVVRASGAPR